MSNAIKFILTPLALGLLFTLGCTQKPSPTPEPEQEEYDQVQVHFISLDASGIETTDTSTVLINQSGVATPAELNLSANSDYRLLIQLFNQSALINSEIIDEGTEHQFFFQATPASGVSHYEYGDADTNGQGIGLDGFITIGQGSFNFKMLLRHGLNKQHESAQQWNSSNYTEAGGEDDLNLTFGIHAAE